MSSSRRILLLLHAVTLLLVANRRFAASITAAPFTFWQTQPDGTKTIGLHMHGDEVFHFVTDELGYAVVKDELGWHVYGIIDDATGKLVPTAHVVGISDPRTVPQLQRGLITDRWNFRRRNLARILAIDQTNQARHCQQSDDGCGRTLRFRRHIRSMGNLKHLVLLMKFGDHEKRKLPSRLMYDKLFNQVGGDPEVAPTGSVKDVFSTSSYGKLTIESTVSEWLSLPDTESYYAEGKSGLGNKLYEALHKALDLADKGGAIQFGDFDADKDGIIDAITFIHSGFGAEWAAEDCDGNTKEQRIWSHQRKSARQKWCGREEICMESYQIAPGLWGRCSEKIGRIGVISHEIGHFLGLLDMYDLGGGGRGIGSYGLMGHCWGFDGSQLYPPIMDPWSRIQLGWLSPTVLSSSGNYSIDAVYDSPQVYKIAAGFPSGEYVLIENREPKGLERGLPQGGLALWHVDERASFESEGYPGQAGWPSNGNHYKVSLMQADGKFDLERGESYGDAGDMWHGGKNHYIGPSNNTQSGPFPNTDSYQGGIIQRTGIVIRDISKSNQTMSFTLILPSPPLPPDSVLLHRMSPPSSQPTRFRTWPSYLDERHLRGYE